MKDSTTRIDILTQCGAGHMETQLFINWRGLSEDQLYALAARAVISAVQQDFKLNGTAPSKTVVEAQWFVDRSTPSPIRKLGRISELPSHLQGSVDKEERSTKVKLVDSIVDRLTDEEKLAILKLLK